MKYILSILLSLTIHETFSQLLIQNVNVISMNDSAILFNQDVLINGDRIMEIGPAKGKALKKGYTVVDGTEKYLMPGFADMHAHLPTDGQFQNKEYMRLMLKAGITTVRSMRGNETEILIRDSLEKGLMQGPRLYVSKVLPTEDSLMKGNWKENFVKDAVVKKYDFVKYLGGIDSAQMKSISELCAKNNLILCGHAFKGSIDKSVNFNFRSVEHYQPFLAKYKSGAVDFSKWNPQQFICPTFSFYYVYGFQFSLTELENRNGMNYISEQLKLIWLDEIRDFEKSQLENLVTDKSKVNDSSVLISRKAEIKKKQSENFRLTLKGLKEANAAGVKILMSADDGIFNVPGFSLYEEMKIFADAGFSPFKIYEITTRNAALFFGRKNYTGTISRNSFADLCLYEKNPLTSIENIKSPKLVIIRGKLIDPKKL
jgi:imidazolonepropionase-like amidohydrolase